MGSWFIVQCSRHSEPWNSGPCWQVDVMTKDEGQARGHYSVKPVSSGLKVS